MLQPLYVLGKQPRYTYNKQINQCIINLTAKSNQELDKLMKHKNIINFARVQRLGWYGHIERMQETRMVKAIHAWKPIS